MIRNDSLIIDLVAEYVSLTNDMTSRNELKGIVCSSRAGRI